MVRYNNYFYISGAISLSLFLLITILFILFMFSPDKIKNFALKKDNYISVSINMNSVKIPKIQTIKKVKPIVKESTPVIQKAQSIDDMFGDVWTKSIKAPKKVVKKTNTRRLNEISKKIKTVKKNKTKSVEDLFENINTNKTSDINKKDSTALVVNEYLAKIQALVYKYFFPPQNSQGNSVEVVINLSAIGQVVDFRILRYSSSQTLNDEADKVKSRLINVVFPKNPDNKSGSYTIILTSKE